MLQPSRTLSTRHGGLNLALRIFQDPVHGNNFTTFPWDGFLWMR